MAQPQTDIMIIDDDIQFLEYLKIFLSRSGYRVRAFHDARAAMRQVIKFPPKLVITDVYMPDFDGIEVLREARLVVPVIGMSGNVRGINCTHASNVLRVVRQLGAVAVFEKPLDHRAILDEVRRHVVDLCH